MVHINNQFKVEVGESSIQGQPELYNTILKTPSKHCTLSGEDEVYTYNTAIISLEGNFDTLEKSNGVLYEISQTQKGKCCGSTEDFLREW